MHELERGGVKRNPWVEALRLLGLGWYVVIPIVSGAALGLLLDNWLDSTPIFTLLGLALGIIAAVWGLYRMIVPMLRRDDPGKEKD